MTHAEGASPAEGARESGDGAGAAERAGTAERAGAAEGTRRPARSRRRALWIAAAATGVVLLVAGALLWGRLGADDTEVVTVGGAEYTTNVPMDEHEGYVYAYIPVNTEVDEIVLEAANEGDSAEIRAFLDDLDTLVPGEHVVELSDSNLHIIVDGMEE